MGAWGHGLFDDDAALDFMADIEESDNPKEMINDAFDSAIDADDLGVDEGNAVIVSGAYVDSQVNRTKFSSSDQHEPIEVDTFPDRHPDQNFSDLKEKAIQALSKVLSENSELNELWEENERDYPAWRQGIEQMIQRLGGNLSEINKKNNKFHVEIELVISKGNSSDAKINITKNGVPYQTIDSVDKKHNFELDFNENYVMECSKQGFTTKIIYFDTHLPKDKDMDDVSMFAVTVELHKEEKGKMVDSSKPVGGIKYNPKKGDFDVSRDIDKTSWANFIKRFFDAVFAKSRKVSHKSNEQQNGKFEAVISIEKIKTFLQEVKGISIGYSEINFFVAENLNKEQVGYSVDSNGNSLVNGQLGDWDVNWIVIGNDNLGDPIIINHFEKELPVFTAQHGEGSWNASLIADSLDNFKIIIADLNKLSVNRKSPNEIEKNPITEKELNEFFDKIKNNNKNIDIGWWEIFLEND